MDTIFIDGDFNGHYLSKPKYRMKISHEFQEMVKALAKPGEAIIESLTPQKMHLLHMGVGVSGEAGELLDCIKKHVIYNKELDMENLIEELGDIEFYLEGIRENFGIDRSLVLAGNMKKLSKRYSEKKYTDQQAQDRKDKE